jgi:hypothetical protein
MITARILVICSILLCLILTGGCTDLLSDAEPAEPAPADEPVPSSYRIAISQPDARAAMIRMDTDVYNAGEVVGFVVTNTGILPLECHNDPPYFRVTFQTGSGRWATKMGPEIPVRGNTTYLQNGQSTTVYRFISTGWEPGRYRIVSDCGPERDFLIREVHAPVPEPVADAGPATATVNGTVIGGSPGSLPAASCPAMPDAGPGPWVTIDPIPEQVAGRPFAISGTTSLPAGTDLYYVIFSVNEETKKPALNREASFSTAVEAGSCGVNTWSAEGVIQATGWFFIAIENQERTATAIRRFSVDL